MGIIGHGAIQPIKGCSNGMGSSAGYYALGWPDYCRSILETIKLLRREQLQ